jgi:NADH-quinone oxidoreductase subunit L
MGGFRRSMPFTFACFVVGGLALSAIPPFSGFFSKDEILSDIAARGGWHIALAVVGYIGAVMTAIYTWRMIFRVFLGEPVAEARELEQGHLHHAEVHTNPSDPGGEPEDTEVGFPGPLHHIAERSVPMKVAMGTLAVLATVAGFLQIPNVTDALSRFLEPTFAGSRLQHAVEPSNALTYTGMVVGTLLGLAGIAIAYHVWVRRPGTSARLIERFGPLHKLFSNKWYADEAIDILVIRPFAWFGRFGQQTFERVFVQNTLMGGTTGVIRAGSAAVRAAQSGLLRAYAALLVLGTVGVALYFLLQS